jgi:hypothetical protein
MLQDTDFSNPVKRLKLSVLVGITASAVFAMLLFIGAAFGSDFATQALLNLSIPKYNVFANFIPVDLSQASNGIQMILGVVILQGALFLSAVIFFAWSFMRKD